ncbi:hypothetical protein BBR01nite_02010 [Brevibacillus brevis]|nr:hypothetical protein BBR01nite_02010 [Brevibacillus brevis]
MIGKMYSQIQQLPYHTEEETDEHTPHPSLDEGSDLFSDPHSVFPDSFCRKSDESFLEYL